MNKRYFGLKTNLIKSSRRTVSLEVTPEKELIIRAPKRLSDKKIEEFIDKKKRWIRKKAGRMARVTSKKFINGEKFLYLGNLYQLNFTDKDFSDVYFNDGFYISKNNQTRARKLMVKWYKKRSLDWLTRRVEKYSPLINCQVNQVKVSWAKKRWGSYSSKTRNINFNWRIVMAPLAVIDYLVVHELVHGEQPNHSRQFWKRVKKILPDYKKPRQWLKDNWVELRI